MMMKRIAAGALTAGLVLGGGAYAAAQDAGDQDSREPAPVAERAHRRHHARPIHADLLVRRDGEWVTVTIDRGTVEGEVGDSVTVVRRDGESVTKDVTDDTRLRGAGPDGEVVAGEPALVVSRGEAAVLVAQRRR